MQIQLMVLLTRQTKEQLPLVIMLIQRIVLLIHHQQILQLQIKRQLVLVSMLTLLILKPIPEQQMLQQLTKEL